MQLSNGLKNYLNNLVIPSLKEESFMAWIYLVIAGLFEIGWPLGLKMAQTMEGKQFTGLAIAVIAMGLSGFFLFSAQKEIPMGTAYAV